MSSVVERGSIAADESEQSTLNAIEDVLQETETARTPRLVGPHGEEIPLPESVSHALRQLVHYLARNKAVTVVPINKELSTQEAADILNISRPHLIKLLEQGAMPFTKVGTHRRIRFDDLMSYKRRFDAEREEALDRLAQLNQEMGLYDL